MSRPVPPLFKYLPPTKIGDFVDQYLSLTPPVYFNDEFEFALSRVPPTAEELPEMFEVFVREEYAVCPDDIKSTLTLGEFRDELEQEREWFYAQAISAEVELAAPRALKESLSKTFGVLSLCEVPDDRRMWAHYTESFHGAVAEFDCCEEHEYPDSSVARWCGLGKALRVTYTRERELLRQDFRNAVVLFCTKRLDWEYEREWRIIERLDRAHRHDEGTGYSWLRFPPDSLKRVILGHRMEAGWRQTILGMQSKEGFGHLRFAVTVPNFSSQQIDIQDVT